MGLNELSSPRENPEESSSKKINFIKDNIRDQILDNIYAWDFWFDFKQSGEKDVFFLYCNKKHTKNFQHHHHAKLGYAITKDFKDIKIIGNILNPSTSKYKDNICIWSGSNFFDPKTEKYYLFYTSRDRNVSFEEQNIFCGEIKKQEDGGINIDKKREFIISPDGVDFQKRRVNENDPFFPAFRDPFVYEENGIYYMFITCRDNNNDDQNYHNGSIGLFVNKSGDITSAKSWISKGILLSPKIYGEAETSQVIKINIMGKNKYLLFFNTWKNAIKNNENEAPNCIYSFAISDNIDSGYNILQNYLIDSEDYYNFRIIDYSVIKNTVFLKVIGFDIKNGGFGKPLDISFEL